jgi:hypothetical protein
MVTRQPDPGQEEAVRWSPERRLGRQDGGTGTRRTTEESLMSRSLRRGSTITFSERQFDVDTLPDDMRRVYLHLEEAYGEEYGLLFIFTIRTAVELHRAWNMVSCSQRCVVGSIEFVLLCFRSNIVPG